MKFSKFLVAGFIAAVVALPSFSVASAASFNEPKVASAYARVVLATDRKIEKIHSISQENQKKIADARATLEHSFLVLDATLQKSDAERKRAVRQLVRAYSNLNILIQSVAKSAAETPTSPPVAVVAKLSENVQILYYSDDFQDSGTSSGDRFSQSTYSAARCSVDLGRLIQVGYGSKSVVVKVNDRPNCSKHPDIVDLSTSAFRSLAPLSKGKMDGSFEVLGETPSGYRKESLSQTEFSDLGIHLDADIPNTYLPGETFRVTGSVTDGKTDTVLFIKSPTGQKYSRSLPAAGTEFSYEIPLLETGKYQLVIASGMGFSTTKTQDVYVLSNDVFAAKKTLADPVKLFPLSELHFVRKESSDLTPINVLELPRVGKNILRTVEISQPGARTLVRRSMGDVAFYPEDASWFTPDKPVHVTVTTSESSTPFSMDAFGADTRVFDADLPLAASYAVDRKEAVSVSIDASTLRIRTDLDAGGPTLRNEAYIIDPVGNAVAYKFPSQALGSDGFVVRWKKAELEIPLSASGQYLVEEMYSNGFPAFNGPVVYKADVVAILPNEYDSATKEADSDLSDVTTNALRYINAVRRKVGKAPLVEDSTLESLARFKANDMADHHYVGHDDSYGEKITGTAKRAGVVITGSVGENVAGGSVGTDFLLAGLSLSAGHRLNMLGEWTKVGVSAVVKDGQTYYVQIFGE